MKHAPSIRRKVTFALFGAFGLVLGLAILALGVFEFRAADTRARTTLESLAESLAFSLTTALDFNNPEVAGQSLARLEPGGIVLGATIYRLDRGQPPRLFASYLRPGETRRFPTTPQPAGFRRSGDRALLVYQVRTDGQPVAELLIEADVRVFRRGLREMSFLLVGLMAALAVVSLALSRLLQRALTQPLVQLAETAAQVHLTGDFTLRAPVTTHDEIGQLATTFNEMLAGIAARDRQLGEQAAFQAEVLENAGVSIISTDAEGTIRTFNNAAERILGYPRTEMIGRATPVVLHDPAELKRRAATLTRRLGREVRPDFGLFVELSRQGPSVLEWTYVRKDGSHCPVFLVLSTLRAPDGRPLGLCGIATDLTERKATEEALRASEERHRSLAENSLVGLLVFQDGVVRYANPKLAEMLGYGTAGELVGQPVPALIAPEYRAEIGARLAQLAAGVQMTPNAGYEALRRDGSRLWITTGASRTTWDNRPALQSFVLDITERKAAEEAVRASEERYRIVVDQTGQIVYDLDLVVGETRWFGNNATRQITGYSIEEFMALKRGWMSHLHPDDQAAARAEFDRCLAAGTPLSVAYRFRRRDGSYRLLQDLGVFVRDPAGKAVRMLGVMSDITERKAAEEAVRASEERFRIVAEQTGQLIFVYEIARDQRIWAGAAASMIGYSLEELNQSPGEWWIEQVHPADQPAVRAGFSRLCQTGGTEQFVYRFHRRDDQWIYLTGIVSAVLDVAGKPVRLLGTIADVTKQQEAAEAVRRLNAELEQRVEERTAQLNARVSEVERLNTELRQSQQTTDRTAARLQEVNSNLLAANQELEAFSYSVSHDLRAPLRNISGFIELLHKRAAGHFDSESSRFFGIVAQEAVRMGALIDDLLEFSRIGRTELKLVSVRMADLVAEVQQELASDLLGRDVEWRLQPMPPVRADRVLLRQVVVNLLSNAVKFTRQRCPAVIEIGVEASPPGARQAVFYVRDNGAGFNPKYADKLFRVFQRLHNAREFEGTGIGLANVKRIVTRHGGRIWAEGAVDSGAVFRFTLSLSDPITPPT